MPAPEPTRSNDVGVRRWLIGCDESGVHGSPHYGFGTLWMSWQRRGDFAADLRSLREHHRFSHECKWTDVHSERDLAFYRGLISYFFQTRWLVFHCLVVRKDAVRLKDFHDGDWDLARRKHFTKLLTNKMGKALRAFPNREHEFLIHVDPIASSYAKADEAVAIISNNVLNQEFARFPVSSVTTKDSKESPAIQLCDLLLGAVMETWQKKSKNSAKAEIRRCIAEHLGWPDLETDTFHTERKFNIWYFYDPPREQRRVVTRAVSLKYPYL
jgi:hypothetical protein